MRMSFPKAEPGQELKAHRRLLTDSITLIALGLSIFLLNSWDNLFVKASVALFWGTFFLMLKGPDAVRAIRKLSKHNDNGRASYELSSQR